MKIVRNTPEQLILQNVPWAIGLAFIVVTLCLVAGGMNALTNGDYKPAVMMLLVGPAGIGLFFALFVRRDDVILDRSRNLIELRHASVFRRSRVRHALSDLDKAVVETQHSANNRTTHRPALVLSSGMDAGTHPLTYVFMSGNWAAETAETINDWLKRSETQPSEDERQL